MKKILIGVVAALAIFALAAPAPAIMKITSQGYFQVQGMLISNNPINNDSRENDWFNMKMIVEPTLHITDNLRLHSQVAILQRNWSGTGAGDQYSNAAQSKYNVFDNQQNNFWVERMYLAYDKVFGGTLTVGRMSGGAFGYAFSDNETNADRIKYTRRFGPVLLGGVYEKSAELDGGQQAPRLFNMAADPSWQTSDNDTDSGGVFAVVPLGKIGLYRGLFWSVRDGNPKGKRGITDSSPNYTNLLFTELGFNLGMLKIDTEILFGWRNDKDVQLATKTDDVLYTQWAIWGEVGVTPGPFELYAGGFWLQGEDSKSQNEDSRIGNFWNVGQNFEPSLLLFSEDMGILYAYRGGEYIPNGSVTNNGGIREFHVRGGYKLTDTMKLTAQWEYVMLDQMELNNVSDKLGWEVDAGFAWKLAPNLTYMVTGAYFNAGNYFNDVYGNDENVYGVRHTIRVEW
jgi:hypothetical protein